MSKCKICGRLINKTQHPRASYCSARCRVSRYYHANKNIPEITKTCPQCGEEWTKKLNEVRKRIFCSVGCMKKAQRERAAEITLARQIAKPKTDTCVQCGCEYKIGPTSKGRKYCSVKCERNAAKVKESICHKCGVVFSHEKKAKAKYCSTDCFIETEREKWRAYRQKRDHEKKERDAKRNAIRKKEAHKRLIVFRETGSNAETARRFNEPESTTHAYLKRLPEYKAAQKTRSKKSEWKKSGLKRGMISDLYKMERFFCNKIESLLIKAGFDYQREAQAKGASRRKVDFIITTLFGVYVVEAKNTNHTSDIDCAIGQSMVRALPFKGVPVVAVPSDLRIDPVALNAARSYGIRVVTEKTIIGELA